MWPERPLRHVDRLRASAGERHLLVYAEGDTEQERCEYEQRDEQRGRPIQQRTRHRGDERGLVSPNEGTRLGALARQPASPFALVCHRATVRENARRGALPLRRARVAGREFVSLAWQPRFPGADRSLERHLLRWAEVGVGGGSQPAEPRADETANEGCVPSGRTTEEPDLIGAAEVVTHNGRTARMPGVKVQGPCPYDRSGEDEAI